LLPKTPKPHNYIFNKNELELNLPSEELLTTF